MLKDMISNAEAQMKLKLEEARTKFTHPGDKGTSAEDSFRKFLREYLPRRLELGNGEIIDSNERRSRQTDVVITNEDHPLTFTPDLPGLFFIEGVSGAGEVKANLTSTELEKALDNSCYFKQLEMNIGKGTTVFSNPSDLNRFFKCPPWFLIAFESQLTLSTTHKKIIDYVESNTIESDRLVDGIFILDRGWIINFGDGKGSFKFRTPEGESVEGWVYQDSDSVLFDLLGWLSIVIPRMNRYEPILSRYILPDI